MELRADLARFAKFGGKGRRRDGRLQRTKTDPQDPFCSLDHPDHIEQGKGRIQIPAVGTEMDSRQDNLIETGISQPPDFIPDILKRPGTDRPAYGRDDAVGTMISAAFLDFQDSPGMLAERADGKTLKRLVILQRRNSTQRSAAFRNLPEQGSDFMPALGSENQIRTCGKKLFSALLGHASADNQQGSWVLPSDLPDQLEGFLIPGSGDRAGVDKIHISLLIHGDGPVSVLHEQFKHRLGIILVHFASEGVGGDGRHDYSISP
jgi:hypothetical protein